MDPKPIVAVATPPDVIVTGAGPVGCVAALALARRGFDVSLVGPAPTQEDRRTTALMVPALSILDALGVRPFTAEEAAPLATMRILDATRRLIRSPPVTFHAAEIGQTRFGLNIPNTVLTGALAAAVDAQSRITRIDGLVTDWTMGPDHVEATVADGTVLRARLAVAADGRSSPARAAAGITTRVHDYRQAALVLSFGHERPHGFISTEFHTEFGPFTQVPLPGLRSSLVWVGRPDAIADLAALDDDALSLRIEEQMQSMLGRVSIEPGRQVFPLSSVAPSSIGQSRVALVGEAAHVLPPIGAQGMNLGIRDAAELAPIVDKHRDDPGAEAALARYRRARNVDIMVRSGAVDTLNRALLSDLLPAQFARSAGLALLGAIPTLRGLFMREAMRPGSALEAARHPPGNRSGGRMPDLMR